MLEGGARKPGRTPSPFYTSEHHAPLERSKFQNTSPAHPAFLKAIFSRQRKCSVSDIYFQMDGTKKSKIVCPPLRKGGRMNSAGVRRPVILIVEDDFLIRMNAAEMIADAGFDVIEAGNADEAIVILEARPDIHVVFTDIQMPGSMDGLKLARFVRGRWPPIKIVATSGNTVVRDGDLPEGGVFLPKPYTFDTIASTLRELVGANY